MKQTAAWARQHRTQIGVISILFIALLLRLLPLAVQAPWMDEAATTIFSVGNSSRSTPMNEVVSLDDFLRPLIGSSGGDPINVVSNLLKEDNHPPLFYLLAHGWYQLFHPNGGLPSIVLSRLLPALLGVAAVPLSYQIGKLALGNRRGGLLTALWMAISPLALAQSLEIRHYSLGIVLGSASLLCLVKAWDLDRRGKPLPAVWILLWIAINTAGVASHYFFIFAVLMQLSTTAILLRHNRGCWFAQLASVGTSMVWLPVLANFAGSPQSSWLRIDPSQPQSLLAIPIQALLAVLFNAVAPGTYAVHRWQWPFAIAAGLATLSGLGLLIRLYVDHEHRTPRITDARHLFATLVMSGLAVQISISFLMLSDYTKGLRYCFFLIPPTTALLGAICEQQFSKPTQTGSQSRPGAYLVAGLLSCGLICAMGVVAGAVLPKWYSSDLLLSRMAAESKDQVVIAYHNGPVGSQPMVIAQEPLSLAWWIAEHPELRKNLERSGKPIQLIMAIDGPGLPGTDRSQAKAAVNSIANPIDLWVISGNERSFLNASCKIQSSGSEGSHMFSHYRCFQKQSS